MVPYPLFVVLLLADCSLLFVHWLLLVVLLLNIKNIQISVIGFDKYHLSIRYKVAVKETIFKKGI